MYPFDQSIGLNVKFNNEGSSGGSFDNLPDTLTVKRQGILLLGLGAPARHILS